MKSPFIHLPVLPWLFLPLAQGASDVTITTAATSGGSFSEASPRVFTPSAATANIQASALAAILNSGTGATIDNTSAFSGNGDIAISTGITKNAGAVSPLTLTAARDISIGGTLTSSAPGTPVAFTAGRDILMGSGVTTGGGSVNLSPGNEFVQRGALNAGAGAITLQRGTMRNPNSDAVTAATFSVASGAALHHTGNFTGSLSVAGRISPAAPGVAGSFQVNGPLALQAGSEMEVELGGTSTSNYDRITATGAVTISGGLKVSLTGAFADNIAPGSVFTILQGAGITGTFSGLPNGSRYTLANDLGTMRVNYTATTVTLDDWQPVVTTLTWDPGTAEAGTQVFTNTNTRAGRHYFRLVTQSADVGAWRTRLTMESGDATLQMIKDGLATTTSYTHRSIQTGSDGVVVRDDQYNVGDQWSIMVHAEEGARWSLFSGKAFVHDLGTLPFTDANGNGQYDIGEAVIPQDSPAAAMPPEGIRFYKAGIPAGTPAWSLWLKGSTREIAVRSNKVPFPDATSRYTRKQAGRMLMIPPLLGAGTNSWFASVSAPMGEMVGLDSRIQAVTDLAFNGSTGNVSVTDAPYRVFRTQVPVDQIAWDISAAAVSGDPAISVRKGNVGSENDNEAFSETPGNATEGITLVPNYLTDGTWYITVWGNAPYTFNLRNGDPVVSPLSFTDVKVNDQPARSGWRFYALTDVPAQVGALGWELDLSNHVPGTQIAVRRNKVPGRWQSRTNGSLSDTNTAHMDDSSVTGFLQRVNHQADVWYVGIFTPQQALGAFTLTVRPMMPQTVTPESSTDLTGLQPLRWRYVRVDVPAGIDGMDVNVTNISGGNVAMTIRRDMLPVSLYTTSNWGPTSETAWPSGAHWASGTDWSDREYDQLATPRRKVGTRLVMPMGHPLQPGTYYIGIYNDGADPVLGGTGKPADVTLRSRIIGTGGSIPIQPLSFTTGSSVNVENLALREAAYFKVSIPANTPSWQFSLTPSAGEMLVALRRGWIPDLDVDAYGNLQNPLEKSARQVRVQKPGGERYVLLPPNGQTSIAAGDYYFAVVSEGVNPPHWNVAGTGPASGVLSMDGPLPVKNLGEASATAMTEAVSLSGAEVKGYQFTVPTGTASLELRLENRTGYPRMVLMSGSRLPQPDSYEYDVGVGGGETSALAGGVGRTAVDDIVTIANPPPGLYSLTMRADEVSSNYVPASADLVIVANAPVPLEFNNGIASITGQAAMTWRYFQVTVPEGVLGWDVRLKATGSGLPSMVVRRDQLPGGTTTTGNWTPSNGSTWPSGNQWAGRGDWTGRSFDTETTPRRAAGDRLVAAMGRPLEPGTYIVGVYNGAGKDPISGVNNAAASYTIESRGIGAGQAIPVGALPLTQGTTVDAVGVTPREAAYFKVTVPPGTPRWEFMLTPSAGESLLVMRRGFIPDFHADTYGDIQSVSANSARQAKIQRPGGERYLMLPLDNQDFIAPGDYYFGVVSEGVNPPSANAVGTGPVSATLGNLGSPSIDNLGAIVPGEITRAVTLAGTQVKFVQFTVPAGTPTLQLRLDNRVGNPVMTLISGSRLPQPDSYDNDVAVTGGQTSAPSDGLAIQRTGTVINLANPPSGAYSLAIRADEQGTGNYPAASATLALTASLPEDVPSGGNVQVTDHASASWKYFRIVVPAGILGWDLRLKNITGGEPGMVVRRDLLPWGLGSTGNWSPSTSATWPSGHQWLAGGDWTGRKYDLPADPRRTLDDRMLATMGRPLEPGTYYIGVYNGGADPISGTSSRPSSYTIESRWIGAGQAIPVQSLGYEAGSTATITNLAPREAAYYKVTIPDNTPSWEFTLAPTNGEMLMVMRRGGIPDFSGDVNGNPQATNLDVMKANRPGPDRYVVLPLDGQDKIVPGDYYIGVVSEGVNPSTDVIGGGASSGVLASHGPLAVPSLGTAGLTPITRQVSLAGTQVKAWQFTVPEGVVSLEVRLNNRIGNPRMALISGPRLPQPDAYLGDVGVNGGQTSTPAGGAAKVLADSFITLSTPPAGVYSLTVRSDDPYQEASADLDIVAKPRTELNFSSLQNGNGKSHTDTRQLTDGQKQFYQVSIPAQLSGQPVLGWQIKVNRAQGGATVKVYKQWGNTGSGITIGGNTGLIVPPFLTFDETWYIEVTASGLTNYTLTSQPVSLERPAWSMPAGHNFTFGDSGNDASGNPLPGDRGLDVGQDDWHIYAVDVPAGNSGLLRTELKAISGNPNLYIREDGVPTTDHKVSGTQGASLVHRQMEDAGSEYGNWVPLNGRTERQLRPGRWYLGVRATGGNARYRLMASTGQVTELDLASASLTNQTLVGRDWRYYRFTVPVDAPATWNLGFTQQVGDVVMWIRDTIPAGQSDGTGGGSAVVRSWASDEKNQGPYEASGHDPAGVYAFATPPLRPGHTYYAGFRANNDATFSITSSATGTTPVATPLAFYGGEIDASVPAGGSLLYRFSAPAEATRLKWSAIHPATVQFRVEQGSIPALTGKQHFTGTGADSGFNQALTSTGWPWQTGQTYYLRIVNSGTAPATVKATVTGLNPSTEDEDGDGLLDAWEMTYFGSVSRHNGSADPDGDGVSNLVEFTDGTNPADINSAKYFLNVNASFGSVAKNPDLPKYDRGTVVTLTATPNAGLVFNGWSGGATGNANPLAITLMENRNIVASFGIELPVALDIAGLTWTLGGDAPWAGQTVTTKDGVDAAQSGAITHSQQSWMETTVSGPGALSFFWKVSSSSGDYLEFHIDGTLQTGRISGTVDWVQKTYNITGAGNHTVRWRYVKDASTSSGSDAGWVDQVSWVPAASGFGVWLSANFTPAETGNPAVSGPNADPDRDGTPNLLEYAFGGDPKNAADIRFGRVVPEVVKVAGTDRLRLRFTLPDASPADLAISAEISDTLAPSGWTTIATRNGAGVWTGTATSSIGNPSAGRREHVLTDNGTASSAGRRMARIKVSLQ